MEITSKLTEIQSIVKESRRFGKTVGFVPTMGALHEGHLTLLRQAKKENNIAVVSVFVNPTQFNNPEDLEKYPRNLESDYALLKNAGCDIVFVPTVEEMYPTGLKTENWSFGNLTKVMEGANRPGHFDGVATVVKRLFEAVPANRAYFGKKDYQQLTIIESMVEMLKIPITIVGVGIVRETDGLAMSSRNMRLTQNQRDNAPQIYRTLKKVVEMALKNNLAEIQLFVVQSINSIPEFELEYFEIADSRTLETLSELDLSRPTMGFIVVNVGNIRLIDNIQIF
jgi:pantoate--beta-alanine ligase